MTYKNKKYLLSILAISMMFLIGFFVKGQHVSANIETIVNSPTINSSVTIVYPTKGLTTSSSDLSVVILALGYEYVDLYISPDFSLEKIGTSSSPTIDGYFKIDLDISSYASGQYNLLAKAFYKDSFISTESNFKIDRTKLLDKTVQITSPSKGAKITSKTFSLIVSSPDADKIELQAKRDGLNNYEYIGFLDSSKKTSDGKWIFNIDNSKRLPNGRYYFVAKSFIGNEVILSELSYYIDISFFEVSEDLKEDIVIKKHQETKITIDKAVLEDNKTEYIDMESKNQEDDYSLRKDSDEGRVIFEDPRETGEIKEEYVIEKVEIIKNDDAENKLIISGRGLPNSLITLFIYSDPIVVTIKTDEEGNWIYELEREIEDGEHEAYVTVTDNTGKIIGKGQPIRFIKTAEAATIIPTAQAISKNQSPTQNSRNNFIFYGIILVIIFMGISLAVVGVIGHKYNYE